MHPPEWLINCYILSKYVKWSGAANNTFAACVILCHGMEMGPDLKGLLSVFMFNVNNNMMYKLNRWQCQFGLSTIAPLKFNCIAYGDQKSTVICGAHSVSLFPYLLIGQAPLYVCAITQWLVV